MNCLPAAESGADVVHERQGLRRPGSGRGTSGGGVMLQQQLRRSAISVSFALVLSARDSPVIKDVCRAIAGLLRRTTTLYQPLLSSNTFTSRTVEGRRPITVVIFRARAGAQVRRCGRYDLSTCTIPFGGSGRAQIPMVTVWLPSAFSVTNTVRVCPFGVTHRHSYSFRLCSCS